MANDFDESSANEEASKGLSWWYSADVLSRDKSDKTAKRIRRISITDRLLRHPRRELILRDLPLSLLHYLNIFVKTQIHGRIFTILAPEHIQTVITS